MTVLITVILATITLFSLVYLRLLRAISPIGLPRLGKPGLFGFLSTAFRYTFDAESTIAEGRKRFSGQPYALPTLSGEVVILGPEYLEMLRSSNDDVFNQPMAVNEDLQLKYTMNEQQLMNPYQATVVRTDLTRGIASLIPEVVEETQLAMLDTFKTAGESGLISIHLFDAMTHLIARISNRVMFGTDLCRNGSYLHAIIQFAETVPLYAPFIAWTPRFFRSTVYFVLSSLFGGKKGALDFIVPYLNNYLEKRKTMDEKPFTFCEFLVSHAPYGEPVEGMAMRMMNMNFGSIHTSSIFITQALFELAIVSDSQIDGIRTEIVEAIELEGGVTKAALMKFRKIDSFLREVGRFHGLMQFALPRITTRDCELPDGTPIPAGYKVTVDMKACHFDPEVYPDAHRFDGFRFSNIQPDQHNSAKFGFTTVDNNYLPFGAGRHACPGRFFAAMELKIMLAFLIMNFDISLPEGIMHRPPNIKFNGAVIPDTKAEIVFRKRLAVIPNALRL